MSDIISRIDRHAPNSNDGYLRGVAIDARNEITALRARLAEVEKERDMLEETQQGVYEAGVSHWQSRAERAEAALALRNGECDAKKIIIAQLEAALATARRDALLEVANMKPTREQIANAAMGYDHSFGLMTPAEQENLMHRAGWWLNAWQHVIRALANEAET